MMNHTHPLLDEIFAKNRALYGSCRMAATEGTDGGDGTDGTDGADGTGGTNTDGTDGGDGAAKPSETMEYWKKRSRENERQARANADAAKKLADLENAAKSEEQRRQEAATQQAQEHESLRLENLRLRAAGANGIAGADEDGVEYADLIGGNDEEGVQRSAKALGKLVKAAQELEAMRKGRPTTGRPAANLHSGAVPPGTPVGANGANGISEAERRFGKVDASN